MLNALTVDVEDWYHTNGLNIPKEEWNHLPSKILPNTMKLLDLFDEFEVKATFFVLGDVAKKFPQLIQEIQKRGHEIGSHGMNHQLVYKQTIEEFKSDFKQSIAILESLTGEKIKYYRAPSWSITEDRLEVLAFLEQSGVECDSSLQPFKTPLSGIKGIPVHPFHPIICEKEHHLIEFPPTVMQIGNNLTFPFAGGFYLRFFPFQMVRRLLKLVNKDRPGLIYVHPWE
ncbi:MAG: polysaccharide deacetylase family protein, partial [Heyndrickxia sp.]